MIRAGMVAERAAQIRRSRGSAVASSATGPCAQVPDDVPLANDACGRDAADEVGLVEPGLDDVRAETLSCRASCTVTSGFGIRADVPSAVTGMPDNSSRGASAPRSAGTLRSVEILPQLRRQSDQHHSAPPAKSSMTCVTRNRELTSGGTGWPTNDPAVDVLVAAGSEDAQLGQHIRTRCRGGPTRSRSSRMTVIATSRRRNRFVRVAAEPVVDVV